MMKGKKITPATFLIYLVRYFQSEPNNRRKWASVCCSLLRRAEQFLCEAAPPHLENHNSMGRFRIFSFPFFFFTIVLNISGSSRSGWLQSSTNGGGDWKLSKSLSKLMQIYCSLFKCINNQSVCVFVLR